ncbi:MAG: matrixin family metalloprotease [Nitrosopumilus sp.]|nr:matrixin family metalloprotease [Nitrosopumilus sp.]
MTNNNNNKEKIRTSKLSATTIKLMTLVAVLTITAIGTSQVYAHTTGYWTDYTQKYICTSSLDTIIHTNKVDPCGDLSSAAQKWNSVTYSNWSLTEASGGSGIYVYGLSNYLPSGVIAGVYPVNPTSPFDNEGKFVVVSKSSSHHFGDPTQGETDKYDYIALMTHEFGHVAGIGHNSQSSSVMKTGMVEGTFPRDPNSHDKSELRGLYS